MRDILSALKYSVHNEHRKTRSFDKEWGFANLGNPMYIPGGKQGFILERLMGLIGLFPQTVSAGYYDNSLNDTKLVKRREAFLRTKLRQNYLSRDLAKKSKEREANEKLIAENRSTFSEGSCQKSPGSDLS